MSEPAAAADELPPIVDAGASRKLLYTLQECARSALATIQAHRLRSFLTMLGVIIGVASVICVIALVQGLSSRITQLFEGLGSSTLTLQADTSLQDRLRGQFNRLRLTDIDELRTRIDGISHITPVVGVPVAQITWGSQAASGQFFGTTRGLQEVQHLFPATGRFLTDSDDDSRRRVVVLGEKIRRDLKMPARPEGEFVQIGREWFKVVGVMESRGEVLGQNLDMFALIPYQTALAFSGERVRPDFNITFVVDDPDAVENVKQRVIQVIRRAHGLRVGDDDDFQVQASDSIAKTFQQISSTVTMVVAGVVGVSLLVGGIGIMNIVLATVLERTREIGVRRATGARRSDIVRQFLVESVLISGSGGLAGIAFGFFLSWMIASVAEWKTIVTGESVLVAVGVSLAVGIVFGIYPARKAARINPIDALRYE